jgi:hypothetical protein
MPDQVRERTWLNDPAEVRPGNSCYTATSLLKSEFGSPNGDQIHYQPKPKNKALPYSKQDKEREH